MVPPAQPDRKETPGLRGPREIQESLVLLDSRESLECRVPLDPLDPPDPLAPPGKRVIPAWRDPRETQE